MKTKNILILENVSELDEVFNAYLAKTQKDHNIDLIKNLANENNKIDLIPHFTKADTLMVCSTFSDRTQLCNMIDLLMNFPNIKNIEILYTYNYGTDAKFMNFLIDFKNDYPEHYKKIQTLVETRNVSEIYYTQYETNKKQYFSTFDYTYDVVQLYKYSETLIYPVRQPISYWINKCFFRDHIHLVVDNYDYYYELLNSNLKYLNEKLDNIENKSASNKSITLSKSDVSKLKTMFEEMNAIINNRNEILSDDMFDVEEMKTLKKERKGWVSVMNKIKTQL